MKSYLIVVFLVIGVFFIFTDNSSFAGDPEKMYFAMCELESKDEIRFKHCLEFFDYKNFAYLYELKNECGDAPIIKNKRCPKGGVVPFCTDLKYNPKNFSGVPGVYNIDYYMYQPEKIVNEILKKEKEKCLKEDPTQTEYKWTVKESGTNWWE